MKLKRSGSCGGTRVGVITSGAGGVGKRTAPDDVQRLLIEQWRWAIIKEKVTARQAASLGVAASLVCPSSLDEITVVTRIGRLRLLRNLGGATYPAALKPADSH